MLEDNINSFKGVTVIENLVTDEECKYLVDFLDKAEDSYGRTDPLELRKISLRPESDNIKTILLKFLEKAKEIYKEDNLFITSYMISSYKAEFEMEPHVDTIDGRSCNKISMVAYLNNDFTGGNIVFPLLNYSHAPKKGQVAYFVSGLEENLHGVEVVTSGIRYVMPVFITDQKEHASSFIHENI